MQILIDIPDEQIEKCLEESKYLHENEGENGSVNIVLLYTNKKLEFVDISRKTEFYSLTDRYTVLPVGSEDVFSKLDRCMECMLESDHRSFTNRETENGWIFNHIIEWRKMISPYIKE